MHIHCSCCWFGRSVYILSLVTHMGRAFFAGDLSFIHLTSIWVPVTCVVYVCYCCVDVGSTAVNKTESFCTHGTCIPSVGGVRGYKGKGVRKFIWLVSDRHCDEALWLMSGWQELADAMKASPERDRHLAEIWVVKKGLVMVKATCTKYHPVTPLPEHHFKSFKEKKILFLPLY